MNKQGLDQATESASTCPKQDLERDYCGYYVCLFIENILESETTTFPTAYVHKRRCKTFSDDRIEHVQREWYGYLYNRFLKDIVNSSA
ncbi:hypothetical protein LIER_08572 [Lithospermum erythrorhizon]|uniref:Uncharacterized protein n=1 Tax=Lithospermum erythrorhizon TaxID=34254 RepID=A0AAV3PCL4_LITER